MFPPRGFGSRAKPRPKNVLALGKSEAMIGVRGRAPPPPPAPNKRAFGLVGPGRARTSSRF